MPYVNATDGLYTNDGQPMKFVWSEVLTGDCDDRDIQKHFEEDGKSPCVEPLGFSSQDLIPIVIGAFIALSQLFKILVPKEGKSIKTSRFSRIKVAVGVAFFALIVSDLTGLLAPNNEMVEWSKIVGAPLPNAMYLGLFTIIGLKSIKSGTEELKTWKMIREEETSVAEMNVQEALFRRPEQNVFGKAPSTKGAEKFRTVGELRSKMGIDKIEDDFERSLSSGMGMDVGKTCHYCNGEGCGICKNSGSL